MVGGFNMSSFENLKLVITRVLDFGKQIVKCQCKIWGFQSLNGLITFGSLFSFFIAIFCTYLYVFPNIRLVIPGNEISKSTSLISNPNFPPVIPGNEISNSTSNPNFSPVIPGNETSNSTSSISNPNFSPVIPGNETPKSTSSTSNPNFRPVIPGNETSKSTSSISNPNLRPVIPGNETSKSTSSTSNPNLLPVAPGNEITKSNSWNSKCDVFEGSWIRDESYPLYNASLCPFAEPGFVCLSNGRKDSDYLKWRWKPNSCEIPRFNAIEMLEKFRGKRVVFVGDSMSRTQWESMICLLMTGLEDKSSVYEVNGNKITKQIRYLGVRFSSFNFTIEFYRSVFLVQPGPVPKRAPKRVKSTLKLDKLDDISKEWIDSDILIFNTGQWWTPGKLFGMGCYFQVAGSLKLGMSTTNAFITALDTWASWVESKIDTNRTRVFFRGYESSHWGDRSHKVCKVTRVPMPKPRGLRSPYSDIIMEKVKKMTVPVTVLHVQLMGLFRSDAHIGYWSDTPLVPDCSHWCLPGVPDMWNEILFAHLLS